MHPISEIEEWRPVVGYEGLYEVSSLGRVRRVGTGKGARAGHILTPALSCGYPSVGLYRDGRQLRRRIYQLVAAAFIGPCPPGREINHKDGVRTNSRPENLEYLTRLENVHHGYRTTGGNRGERHGHAKLTEADVREILAARPLPWGGQTRLAARYSVCQQTIQAIVAGKGWAWMREKAGQESHAD
jgi:hypothetical protein